MQNSIEVLCKVFIAVTQGFIYFCTMWYIHIDLRDRAIVIILYVCGRSFKLHYNIVKPGAKKLLFTVSPTLYLLMFIATCQGKFTHYTY